MAKIQRNLKESIVCGVFFALMLDKRFKKADGKYNVSVRVTNDYRRQYIATGVTATEEEFDKMLRANKGEWFEVRKKSEAVFDRVLDAASALIDANEFSFSALHGKISRKTSFSTLLGIGRNKVDELGREGKIKTAEVYRNALSKIGELCGDVELVELDVSYMQKFIRKMKEEGLSDTTVSIYLRALRALCNYAIENEIMTERNYPFSRTGHDKSKARIPKGSKRIGFFLDIADVTKLYLYETDDPRKREAVDLWLFSYLANGMNFIDMAFLRYGDEYFSTHGRELDFIRKKTESTTNSTIVIKIPVTAMLRNVMDRIAARSERNALVLPQIVNGHVGDARRIVSVIAQKAKTVNKYLRIACMELGIDESCSMTWARHSFKTNLIRKGVPDYYTEQAMGHADDSVGSHYVAMFSLEDRMKYNSMLIDADVTKE